MRKYSRTFLAYLNGSLLFTTEEKSDRSYAYRISSGKMKRTLDAFSESMTLSIPASNPFASSIAIGDNVKTGNTSSDFDGYVKEVERDKEGNADVSVIGWSSTLKNINCTFFNPPYKVTKLKTALSYLFSDINKQSSVSFSYVNSTDLSGTFYMEDGKAADILESLVKQASDISGEKWHYYILGEDVYLKPESGMGIDKQTVEFGKNIVDIQITNSLPDATVIYVTGEDADGNPLSFTGWNDLANCVANEDLAEKVCVWDEVDFGNTYSTGDALKAAAQTYIDNACASTISYQVDAIDLYGYGEGITTYFGIGDRVNVLSTQHGIDDTVPISELTVDFCNPLKTKISINGKRPRITG